MSTDSKGGNYKSPYRNLLKCPFTPTVEIEAKKRQIVEVFHALKVEVQEIDATIGPSVSLFEVKPCTDSSYKKLRYKEDAIAASLGYPNLRVMIPMPGKKSIGIEIPNEKAATVPLGTLLGSKDFQETAMQLPCAIGKSLQNEIFMFDLAEAPQLLVAGASGQGKTTCLHTIISSLLYKKTPSELQLVLMDCKKHGFDIYAPLADSYLAQLPGNAHAIVSDLGQVLSVMTSLKSMLFRRYEKLKEASVRNITEYNRKFPEQPMPYIVTVIDECSDLLQTLGEKFKACLKDMVTKGRAAGMHAVVCIQSPTSRPISSWLRLNFPARIAFKVPSRQDSCNIIDQEGAECLIGRGDLLINMEAGCTRVQVAFIDEEDIRGVIELKHWLSTEIAKNENKEQLLDFYNFIIGMMRQGITFREAVPDDYPGFPQDL